MPVTYLIKFAVIPEQRPVFLDLLNGVLDAMRHEDTFHEAMLLVDPECADNFLLYETWESHEEVLAVQLHRRYRDEWHARLDDLLVRPRDISVWRSVRMDRRGGG